MRLFGLIGKKLGHSLSQAWFREQFRILHTDADYRLFEIDGIGEVHQILDRFPALEGFNVTIPFKKEILSLCDALSPEVQDIGAANCIRIDGGKLNGYNTDVDGFAHLLSQVPEWDKLPGAMVLGTGGAAMAAAWVFHQHKFPFVTISRNPRDGNVLSYDSIRKETIDKYPLIVNATPAGMWPGTGSAPPLPYPLLTGREILVDLVYNPEVTLFMKMGMEKGCFAVNGLEMLYHQALRSWEIWNR